MCQLVKRGNLSNFPSLEEIVDDDESIIPNVCEESVNHLKIPSRSFDGYFGGEELETSEKWIIDPYFFNLDYMSNDEKLKDDLIKLRINHVLEMQFESKTLEQYWSLAMDMFPKLCEKASHSRRLTYASLDLVPFCQSRQNLETT